MHAQSATRFSAYQSESLPMHQISHSRLVCLCTTYLETTSSIHLSKILLVNSPNYLWILFQFLLKLVSYKDLCRSWRLLCWWNQMQDLTACDEKAVRCLSCFSAVWLVIFYSFVYLTNIFGQFQALFHQFFYFAKWGVKTVEKTANSMFGH